MKYQPVIVIGGVTHKIKTPYEGASYADVLEMVCPHCGEELRVQGTGRRITSRDTYAASALCVACETVVGELRLKVDTLFGLEEDEAVFRLGVKIY